MCCQVWDNLFNVWFIVIWPVLMILVGCLHPYFTNNEPAVALILAFECQ